jgi:PAS domain S-box-containing protein
MDTEPMGASGAGDPLIGLSDAHGLTRVLLDSMTEGVTLTRRDGILVYANPAEEALFGYGPGELIGRPVSIQNAYPEAENARIVGEVIAELERSGAWRGEWLNLRKDGSTFVSTARITRVELGGEIYWLCVRDDITDEHAALAALRESEARLEVATEAAQLGIWDWDVGTGRMTYSARAKAICGFPPDLEVTYEDARRVTHPEDYPRTSAMARRALDPNIRSRETFEYRILRPDGEVRWAVAQGEAVFAEVEGQTRAVRYLGAIQDITERKILEERLRASEAELRRLNTSLEAEVLLRTGERNLMATIVETTDAFILVLDLDYRVMAVNKAGADEFERIFGLRPQAGDDLLTLLDDHPEQQAAVRAMWSRALTGEAFTVAQEFGDARLDQPCYELKFNPLLSDDGVLIGSYQYAYDVTERLRSQAKLAEAQEALRQSQKLEAMGQLTGGVAHDFNNLLTPILGSLDMLSRRDGLDERTRRLLDGALQSAERAKVLVQRLLAFARRQPLQPRSVDVGRLVTEMSDLVASTSGPQIRVVVDIADDLPSARADPNQLEMAILNLAVNARDAMPDGGTLRISATAEQVADKSRSKLAKGRYVRISVADTGVGMDEATLARAVEPFFSTKGIGKGTGLGLSMVHGLASQLGGAVEISSRPGLGANIELWLPVGEEAPAEPASAPAAPGRSPARGVVLLIDDEDLVRASTADQLKELGYAVIEAASAEAGLQRIDTGDAFDILVTDHLMPGMSGLELASALHQRRLGLPVLIVSGYAEEIGIAADVARLSKPFRLNDLSDALTALTASSL